MLCISGKDDLNLIDLLQLCIHFPQEVPLGKELHKLLKEVIATNVRPRFTAFPLKLHYKNYLEMVPN